MPRERWLSAARRVALTGVSGLLVFVVSLLWPYRGFQGQIVVLIEQRMSRLAIAHRLTEQGVLFSRWPFLLYAYLQPFRTLKAGEYSFDRRLNTVQVFAKLQRGEVHLYTLTVPEGWTRWDIADELNRQQLAPREAFLQATEHAELVRDWAPEARTLEGYLFPDSYRFARPSDPTHITRVMVERFRQVYGELRQNQAAQSPLTVHQVVTLASLVEKETGLEQERGLVAAVLSNRLRRALPLQCDPTVIYAARLEKKGEFDGVINVSDLERDSPYNTYRHAGLPPGPIASPGRAALEAALHPPASDYLYFVSNTRGGHFFAATARQHERNVARYQQLRTQKAASRPPPRRRERRTTGDS
jgi:UPF0755 protein